MTETGGEPGSDDVPSGGDAYVLAVVVHDWPDAEAVAVLHACHRAMAPGAGGRAVRKPRLWSENVGKPGEALCG